MSWTGPSARRQQRVAGAPEEARAVLARARDVPHERGLADPRLAGHEDDPAVSGARLRQRILQCGQRDVSLEQHMVSISSQPVRLMGHHPTRRTR
jgi:hypothetical protein